MQMFWRQMNLGLDGLKDAKKRLQTLLRTILKKVWEQLVDV